MGGCSDYVGNRGATAETIPPENTIVVSPENGNYASIKNAMDSISDNSQSNPYLIDVYPGVYSENNPITCKSFVTLRGNGNVTIDAQNNSQNVLELQANSFIYNIAIQNSTNACAIYKNTTGNSTIQGVTIIDCDKGICLDNSAGTMFARDITLLTALSTISKGVELLAGNLTIENTAVGSASTITTIIDITGVNSIATINTLLSFSANVTIGFLITTSARVVSNNTSLVGMTDGVVLESGVNYRANALTIFNAQQDGLKINDVGSNTEWVCNGCTIEDSTRYDINILSATATAKGLGTTAIDKLNFVSGAQLYGIIIDDKEDDEGVNILGELHVGIPEIGAESVLGEGDSYTRGMLVYTETELNVFTDVSDIAASASASTFTFPGVVADNSIYFASTLNNSGGFLKHYGIKAKIDTAATIGAGEIIAEYWNGSVWTEFNGCTSESNPGFLKFAKNYFNQTGSYHIKYNPYITDNWTANDPMSLGTNYYWIRYRIATAITTSPAIQQTKLHTNRAEYNIDGTYESHGDARTYKKLVVDAVRPLEGNMQNASIYVDENVGVGLENNRFTTAPDLLGISFELPEDCDTSAPLIFVWKGKFASTGNVQFTARLKVVQPGDAYTNTEPSASGDVITVTTGTIAIATADVREDFRIDLDISNAIPSRQNSFGDEIWITLQYDTRGAGNFDYTKLSANYLSDFNGRHVRQ